MQADAITRVSMNFPVQAMLAPGETESGRGSESTAARRAFDSLKCASTALAVCSLFLTVTMLTLFVVHFGRQFFNSDDAVASMLAESMWQQGRLLPHDWITNNGDLMVPSIALIVAPLLNWFPDSFGLHSIGGMFAVILMAGSLICLLRSFAMPLAVVVFLTTLLASGFCSSFISVIYTQTTYVWWPAGFFLGAAIIHRQRTATATSASMNRWWAVLLFALVFSISFANPGRVAVMMVFPLYVFDRVLHHGVDRREPASSHWRRWLRLAGMDDRFASFGIVAGFVLAAVAYVLLAHAGITRSVNGAAGLHWGGWPSVWGHLLTFRSWFVFLGAPSGMTFASIRAIDNLGLFRWIVAVWITWIGVSEVVKLRDQADVTRRALAAAMLTAFVLVAVPYILLDPLAVNGSALRYFMVPNCIAVAISAFSLRNLLKIAPATTRVGLAVAGALLAFVAAPLYVPVTAIGTASFWNVGESRTMRLAHILRREGLEWGYASWWNAGATMVHASSAIRIWPVVIAGGGVVPFWSMVSTAWYRPEAWTGSTFLCVTDEENSSAEMNAARKVLGEPRRRIDGEGFSILVYDHNISRDFFNASWHTLPASGR